MYLKNHKIIFTKENDFFIDFIKDELTERPFKIKTLIY